MMVGMAVDDGEAVDQGGFTFDFFEVVTVTRSQGPNLRGARATILGRSRSEDAAEFYAIRFDRGDEVFMVASEDLQATGQRRRRDEFYDGSSIGVSVRGEPL